MLNHLIRAALQNNLKNPRYAYIAPTYKQAKAIAFDYLKILLDQYKAQLLMKQN